MSLTYLVLCSRPLPPPETLFDQAFASTPADEGLAVPEPGAWHGAAYEAVQLCELAPRDARMLERAAKLDFGSIAQVLELSGPATADWDYALFTLATAMADHGRGAIIDEEGGLVHRGGKPRRASRHSPPVARAPVDLGRLFRSLDHEPDPFNDRPTL